jgi:hypothetical protein
MVRVIKLGKQLVSISLDWIEFRLPSSSAKTGVGRFVQQKLAVELLKVSYEMCT